MINLDILCLYSFLEWCSFPALVGVCRTAQTVSEITTRKALAFLFATTKQSFVYYRLQQKMVFTAAL